MPPEKNELPDPMWLSEDDAHRLLARAVELDSRDVTDVSLAQLRDVANEAGIAPDAFDRALRELTAGRHSFNAARRAGHVRFTLATPFWRRIFGARGTREIPLGVALSERLAKSRRPAILAIVVLAEMVTRGDMLYPTVMLGLPAWGLYEASIVIARWIERRRGRPLPPLSAPVPMGADTTGKRVSPPSGPDRMARSLLLRTA